MFRNRRSQKPSDELYKSFKANFPQVNRPSSTDLTSTNHIDAIHATTSLTDALDMPLEPRSVDGTLVAPKDASSTPRATTEHWSFGASGLTPSVLDPAGHGYNMFANHLPDYYTPTSAGLTMYHHQAGDLHTPNYGLGFATPLSMSTSEGPVPAGEHANVFHGFQPHSVHHVHRGPFDNIDPFHTQPVQSFPPHHFSNHPPFGHYDAVLRESPTDDSATLLSPPQPDNVPPMQSVEDRKRSDHSAARGNMPPPPLQPVGERFRYHVTLNAPTAMIKHIDEIPITYLNKGQVYSLNVVDTRPRHSNISPRYRTFVRVSFEDNQQRERPAVCWQLWKEGRGTNEAHQRGGRLQAVEHVESGQLPSADDLSRPRIELQNASFDGFCVTWSPPLGSNECSIAVRFNFLSTDFSHSKGVKGIPVRLCAKTELLQETPQNAPTSDAAEVCYCKVKLFRDHGAERKLSNDVAHVKKTIDKLNQQIVQIESGVRDNGKRKRSVFSKSGDERPGKVAKHRRTWSTSSLTASGSRNPAEDELHLRLATLQDMFTSTRPASVLHLKGAKEDDPDLHPVKLSAETEQLIRHDSGGTTWDRRSTSSLDSPSPSTKSPTDGRRDSTLHQHSIKSASPRLTNPEWYDQSQTAIADLVSDHESSTVYDTKGLQSVKVKAKSPSQPWLDVLDLDPEYEPPPPRAITPVACIYIKKESDTVYRAVYLKQRTSKDINNAIALKMGIEPTRFLQTVRINRRGLQILFDDDCVRELAEGQDVIVELAECNVEDADDHVQNSGVGNVQTDGDMPVGAQSSSHGYKLILRF